MRRRAEVKVLGISDEVWVGIADVGIVVGSELDFDRMAEYGVGGTS